MRKFEWAARRTCFPMAKITFKKPDLDHLLGIPWWIPAAIAAVLYLAIRWGIPAMPASNPVFKIAGDIFRPLGILIAAVCGVLAAFLYYKQRSKPSRAVRLLEPHFSTPTSPGTQKNPEPETVDQALGDSVIDSGLGLPATKTPEWSVELLRQIDWKGFEELVAAYFREESFRTATIRIGSDEGSDIELYEKGRQEVYAVAQCRSCTNQPVGVRLVRELLGAMTHAKVPRGIFVTTGDYTQEAIDFAKEHPIILITGDMLINDVLSCSDVARTRLMNVLTESGFRVMQVAPEELSTLVSDAVDEESNSLDFPTPELAIENTATNAVSGVAEENEPTENNPAPADHLEKESTTLDFPVLEFPASEPKTKTTEFFGVFK